MCAVTDMSAYIVGEAKPCWPDMHFFQENPDIFKWLTGQEQAPDNMLKNSAFRVRVVWVCVCVLGGGMWVCACMCACVFVCVMSVYAFVCELSLTSVCLCQLFPSDLF
jgi:hypothetical protein